MLQHTATLLAQTAEHAPALQGNILLLVGLAIFGGTVGARIFKRLKFPQVVGYIIMGVLLGRSVLGWIKPADMAIVTSIALGLIGFSIGSQLKFFQLRSMGKSILWISLLEAFGAFFLVGLLPIRPPPPAPRGRRRRPRGRSIPAPRGSLLRVIHAAC